VASAETVELQ
jgi:hypothetical protein